MSYLDIQEKSQNSICIKQNKKDYVFADKRVFS